MEEEKDIFNFLKKNEREELSDDFFAQLAQQVIQNHPIQHPPKVIPFYRRKLVISIASVAALLILMVTIYKSQEVVSHQDVQLASSDVYHYVNENIDQFDEHLLVAMVDEYKLENPIQEPLVKGITNNHSNEMQTVEGEDVELNKSDILDYLNQEGLSVHELENTTTF